MPSDVRISFGITIRPVSSIGLMMPEPPTEAEYTDQRPDSHGGMP